MLSRLSALACCFGVVLTASGCAGTDDSVPPAIRLGRDECAECGMLINEDRFSTAAQVMLDGRKAWLLFDDIGDMLDHERDQGYPVVSRFVHDHETRRWQAATGATFVYAESVRTPMGSGLAAFADYDRAAKRAAEWKGRTMSYDEVVAFRIKYMQDRYGGE